MGLYKDLHGSRYMMQLFIIKLVWCLGWLSAIAFGQLELSETVSGAVSFPDLGITCLGNVAVFFSSFLRGRLYLEMGAKDALTFLTGRIKLKKINGWNDTSNGFGWTTCEKEGLSDCSVVMLSTETPNSSMRQFVEYVANVHHVHSVLLQYIPLQSLPLAIEMCTCQSGECRCIVFSAPLDVRVMVAKQIPGTLKPLYHSFCLLPSIDCLKKGCHGCNQGLLHVEEIVDTSYFEEDFRMRVSDVEESEAANEFGTKKKRVREGEKKVEHYAAVCESLYSVILDEPAKSICIVDKPAKSICIPVLHNGDEKPIDRWTELLVGSFKCKDYETRGAIIRREKSSVSDDLENYLDQKGKCYAAEEYSIVSLIVPRFTDIVINLILTFWFKVDGFSSSLVARRAVRDYIVDNSRRGFAAHVFMNKAEVRSNDDNTNVYQVLSFRGNVWNPRALSLIVGIVNLACSITWAVLVAMEGHGNKWYDTHSMPPSKGRLLVIFVGIAIALAMDCVDLYLYFPIARSNFKRWLRCIGKTEKQREELQKLLDRARIVIVCTMIVFQILCIVSISVVGRAWGVKAFGKWVYGAVQGLVWLKWGIGSYLVGQYIPRECSGPAWRYGSTGMYMYSSAFLAGARAKWEFL